MSSSRTDPPSRQLTLVLDENRAAPATVQRPAENDAVVALEHFAPLPKATRCPVTVYLAGLAPSSRSVMRAALANLAQLISPDATPETIPWHQLRYEHTQGLRALLLEHCDFAPATVNRHLAALRGVLAECWRL